MHTKDWLKKTKGRDNLKNLGLGERVHTLLKLILEKLHVWYGLDSTVQEWVQLIFVDVVMNLYIL
jgi:hypothetical protein